MGIALRQNGTWTAAAARGSSTSTPRPMADSISTRTSAAEMPSLLRVLLEAPLQQLREPRVQPRRQRTEIGVDLDDRREDIRGRLAVERLPSREQLEEDAAEREEVAALIGFEAFRLL